MDAKYILLQVKMEKPVESLVDLVAGRAYTIDGVSDVHAVEIDQVQASSCGTQALEATCSDDGSKTGT